MKIALLPGKTELFDLAADPDEKNDVADQNPEVVRDLETRLIGYAKQQKMSEWLKAQPNYLKAKPFLIPISTSTTAAFRTRRSSCRRNNWFSKEAPCFVFRRRSHLKLTGANYHENRIVDRRCRRLAFVQHGQCRRGISFFHMGYREGLPRTGAAIRKGLQTQVTTTFRCTLDLKRCVASRKRYDVVIVVDSAIDYFIESDNVEAGSRVDIAKSSIEVGIGARLHVLA